MDRKIIVITDMRSREAGDAVPYLQDEGYDVRPVPEEVCLWDEEAVRSWVEPFKSEIAGIIHPAPPVTVAGIEEITEEMWAKNANEGPVAALIVTKVFGQILRENGGGAIIYLNSIHAEKPLGRGYLFSMDAGAVQMLCREFAQDHACFNVRPYFVMRGPSEEESFAKNDLTSLYFGMDMRYSSRKMPEKGYLNPLLSFLLSEDAAPLVGSDVKAEGGYTGFYGNHHYMTEGRAYEQRK